MRTWEEGGPPEALSNGSPAPSLPGLWSAGHMVFTANHVRLSLWFRLAAFQTISARLCRIHAFPQANLFFSPFSRWGANCFTPVCIPHIPLLCCTFLPGVWYSQGSFTLLSPWVALGGFGLACFLWNRSKTASFWGARRFLRLSFSLGNGCLKTFPHCKHTCSCFRWE